MILSIMSFTANGIILSEKVAKVMGDIDCNIYTKCSRYSSADHLAQYIEDSIVDWSGRQFEERNAILFIGACGIAVRAIAPHITDKLKDIPVLVMDEMGQFVIPVLSGHVGGANEFAETIGKATGAKPVITTATDINNRFAIDLFAKNNELTITDKDGIAKVSSKVLSGEDITISIEQGHFDIKSTIPSYVKIVDYPPLNEVDVVITSENTEFDSSLILKPKEYVIGIGCRKGKEADIIDRYIIKHLHKTGISLDRIAGITSIDVKKDEPGIVAFSNRADIPFITYSAEELMCVEGDFHRSEFVKQQVGVDNVCERAALKLCGPGGELTYDKRAEDGMTIAIAKRVWRVTFDE